MSNSPNKKGIIVGLFIIIGIVFLLAAILAIGNLRETFVRKIGVTVLFDDVSGLQSGNNIWFSGVKIGTVSKLKFLPHSKVSVIMKIDRKSVPFIHKDAKVKLGTDGLIGNKILIIYGGSEKFPEVEEGDTLGVEETFSTEDMMNTFQENNKNFLVISENLKTMSQRLVEGQGSVGKLMTDETLYNSIGATLLTLQKASASAESMMKSFDEFSKSINKKGTLPDQILNDTIIYASLKRSALRIKNLTDTANLLLSNIKTATENPKSPLGVILHDEQAGADLKATIKQLESSSKKLDEDLEGLQHSFPMKKYFKKKAKEDAKNQTK